MELLIQRQGEKERRHGIDRLVSTVGFGDGCDVMLAPSGRTERLGMFIQQGEGLSFRPLHSPSGAFLKGLEIESMVVLDENAVLRLLDFDLSWNRGAVEEEAEFKPWVPKKVNLEHSARPSGYRAGALSAYSGQKSSTMTQEFEGVQLELSDTARQSARLEKPTLSAKVQQPANSVERPLNSKTAIAQESSNKAPERSRLTAEEELRRKLELARQQSSSSPPILAAKSSSVLSSPLSSSSRHGDDRDENLGIEIFRDESRHSRESQPSTRKKPPAQNKDVLKHFFNHLDIEFFWSAASERRATLTEGLRLALQEVMGEDENSPNFSKFEKELKSSGPLKKLLADPAVCGVMIRDKGLLFVDRGKGFDQPELSFFNAAHAYWTLDRLLLGSGIRMDWRGGKKSFTLDRIWGGRVILPEVSWQGAYVVMRKREIERLSFSMDKTSLLELAKKVKLRENLLLVAPDRDTAKHLSYWFLKQAESLGAVLVLSQNDLSDMGDFPRRIGVRRGDEALYEWLDWSEDMDLAGILHGDALVNGFELIRRLTHQSQGWWQMVVSNDPAAAFERLELDLSLEKPEVHIDLHRRLIKGAFGSVVSIGGKSISGRRNELKLQTPVLDQQGHWGVQNAELIDDWS